jgi:VanZ family protein
LNTHQKNILKTWIAAILWLIVIAIESSSLGASTNTSRILYPIFHYLFGMNYHRFEHWHVYMRKGGHVFGYGLLSILLFRAWRETFPVEKLLRWALLWASLAVVGTAVVASLDEWHQSFNPLRTGTVRDVFLDTGAAVIAQFLVFLWLRRSNALPVSD